jgi:hypothetical protein
MAISFEPQFDHPLWRHAEKSDITAMQTEPRFDRIKRPAHPRFQIEWMQAVED